MEPKVKTQEKPKAAPILPKTKEMEAFLGVGYNGLTVSEAETIIKDTEVAIQEKVPQPYPIQDVRNARAFLAAYNATPKVVATREMWQRPVRA